VSEQMTQTAHNKRGSQAYSSVQERLVHVREVHDQVLCLASDRSPSGRDYVTVLEVEGINYGLKSPEEQNAVIAKYRALLNGLSYPLQILVRILPLNLAPYIAHLTGSSPAGQEGIWEQLARSHKQLLEQLARERTLLERHFYLVVPATLADDIPNTPGQRIQQVPWPWGRRQHTQRAQEEAFDQVSVLLATRARELIRQLGKMGLHARRLSQQELITLYAHCLLSQRAVHAPLPEAVLAGIGRPHQPQGSGQATNTLGSVALVSAAEEDEEDMQQGKGTKRTPATTASPGMLPFSQLADRLAPASVTLSDRMLCLGHAEPEYVSTIIIDSLPRELPYGWLKPLLELSEPLELSIHLRPLNRTAMIGKLRWARTGQDALSP